MKFGLLWFHMARYELTLRLDRSPMAHDHFKTPPDPTKVYTNPKMTQQVSKLVGVALG